MSTFTMSERREIIEDFAQEIAKRKHVGPKPETTVIKFRNEYKDNVVRKIYYVPIELLRYRNSFLCRVRSKDGAVGLSVGHSGQLRSLYPIFTNLLQPFFIDKDALIGRTQDFVHT